MKKLLSVILFFYSLNTFAQTRQKIDSIYYLIDTMKTPVNARMWEIHDESPSFKVYTIQCPCLAYSQEPTFTYNTKATNEQSINKGDLKFLKLISITTLIQKAKQFTSNDFKGKYAIFLGEPSGNGYIFHQVHLFKPRGPSIDYENVQPDSVKK